MERKLRGRLSSLKNIFSERLHWYCVGYSVDGRSFLSPDLASYNPLKDRSNYGAKHGAAGGTLITKSCWNGTLTGLRHKEIRACNVSY